MAINASVQHNRGFLPGIILLTQCYYHREIRLNPMERFCICSLWSHLNVSKFPPDWGMLRRSKCVQIFMALFLTFSVFVANPKRVLTRWIFDLYFRLPCPPNKITYSPVLYWRLRSSAVESGAVLERSHCNRVASVLVRYYFAFFMVYSSHSRACLSYCTVLYYQVLF